MCETCIATSACSRQIRGRFLFLLHLWQMTARIKQHLGGHIHSHYNKIEYYHKLWECKQKSFRDEVDQQRHVIRYTQSTPINAVRFFTKASLFHSVVGGKKKRTPVRAFIPETWLRCKIYKYMLQGFFRKNEVLFQSTPEKMYFRGFWRLHQGAVLSF